MILKIKTDEINFELEDLKTQLYDYFHNETNKLGIEFIKDLITTVSTQSIYIKEKKQ